MKHQANYSKSSILNYGFDNTRFVARGLSSGYDYSNSGLTEDAAWHDMDLDVVPANAVAVLMRLVFSNTVAGKFVYLRPYDDGDPVVYFNHFTPVSNSQFCYYIPFPLVYDGVVHKIQYAFQDNNFTYYIHVAGWWI